MLRRSHPQASPSTVAPRSRSVARLGVLTLGFLTLVSSACRNRHYHDDDDGHGAGFVHEQEPNDHADHPDFFGYVGPGDRIDIRGHVQHFGPDQFDGFGFVSAQPIEVFFTLRADDPFADLDLLVYDPFVDDFVAIFDSPQNPERGAFLVLDPDVEFHMVVDAYDRSSAYLLEIDVAPAGAGLAVGDGSTAAGAQRRFEVDAAQAPDAPRAKPRAWGYGRDAGTPDARDRVEAPIQAPVEAVLFERALDGSWTEHRVHGVVQSSGVDG